MKKASYLTNKINLDWPLIGFYDTPNSEKFNPYKDATSCVFAHFKLLKKGKSIRITKNKYGCGGAGKWLCGLKTRTLEQYVTFLADDEGLKANHQLMREWLEYVKPYEQEYPDLFISPLIDEEYDYLKTVSFVVNPDQLSILMIGAQLFSSPKDPEPVIAPFGSGCMLLVSLFKDLDIPQAMIGGTDMAMRKYFPPDKLTFTVTKPMFERLCSIGTDSYMEKSFYKEFKKARKGRF